MASKDTKKVADYFRKKKKPGWEDKVRDWFSSDDDEKTKKKKAKKKALDSLGERYAKELKKRKSIK